MKLRFLAPFLTAACLLWGANFWDVKPFTSWSEKEVNKILGDSPWSKTTTTVLDMSKMRELMPPSGEAPSEGGGLSGGGRGGGGGGRKGGGGGGPGMAPMFELMVRWHSSLTVRQAMVRGQFGDEAATSEKAAEFLSRPQSFYVIAVSRLPMRFFQRANPEQMQKILAGTSTLTVKGLDNMKPGDIQFQSTEQLLTVFFAFPRDQQILLEHKEAEFAATIGPLQVKRKFKLADMVREGKLDL
jgi:hypothetical protein